MIHYFGTPITPRAKLLAEMRGRCFCVRYREHADIEVAHEIGMSVMLDNGAYPAWTKGLPTDWPGFAQWARGWLDSHTTWAVIPDVIDGDEEANDALVRWLYANHKDVWERSAPVWHMHESIDRLKQLCHGYSRVCIGSSGRFRMPGTDPWKRRMDEAFNAICGNGPAPVWLHMLRAMEEATTGDWPFASADSTNLARNHAGNNQGRPARSLRAMAEERGQPPARWRIRHHTGELEVAA